MRVRDAIEPWPPSSWSTSFQGADNLTPHPERAVVYSAHAESEGVSLRAAEGERQFSTVLLLSDRMLIHRVTEALLAAKGKSLEDAGDQPLEVQD